MPELNVIEQGIVFAAPAGSPHASATRASIIVNGDGRWLLIMRTAPAKVDVRPQHVMITWSDDEGKTWSEPREPFVAPNIGDMPGTFRVGYLSVLRDGCIGATLMWVDASNPELPFFNQATQGLLLARPFLSTSADGGETWSEPRLLDPAPFEMSTPITGPVLVNERDEWLLQFETQKTYDDPGPWVQQAVMLCSNDQGEHWDEAIAVAHDREGTIFYWDMRVSMLGEGAMVAAFWTYVPDTADYRNIRIAESTDGGHTWSEPVDSGVPGQPGPIVAVGNGNLALVYVDREATPAIKLRLSDGELDRWPRSTVITLAQLTISEQESKATTQDAWNEMNAFSIGLPQATALPGGDILVTWYQGKSPDHTQIHWARLRCT